MKKTVVFYVLAMMIMAITAFADIYKCVSDDGVVKYSDEPCGKQTEVILRTSNSKGSLDDAMGVAPFSGRIGSRKDIINELRLQAINLVKLILPEEEYKGVKAQSFFGSPGGVTFSALLGSPKKKKVMWDVSITYSIETGADKGGDYDINIRLKSITILKDGNPFSPASMNAVKRLNEISEGRWEAPL